MSKDSECVRSKYFVCKTDMDDSLSDFQETKKNCKGPKAIQKPTKLIRKNTKRPKGQKDIRSALKGKSNELLRYSKEFDAQCKKSGIDIDSEELQLAIALSNSLQTKSSDDASTSQFSNKQSRIANIRTTLKEYGFKVPEIKKKQGKHKKHYKLLETTAEEKKGIITSRYSQILFESPIYIKFTENSTDTSLAPIFNIATNLIYEHMKDNSIFYVNNLVEKSSSDGCLLRDWSEIAGRPVSPHLFDKSTMNISEILCSQEELDVILSGSLKSAKDIIKTKNIKSIDDNDLLCDKDLGVNDKNSTIIKDDMEGTSENRLNSSLGMPQGTEIGSENIDTLAVRQEYRSVSPDIFDDEVSCIMEVSNSVILSQGLKTKIFTEDANTMDLTECVGIPSQPAQNLTNRKSDDFMEITECAVSASQGVKNLDEIVTTESTKKGTINLNTGSVKDLSLDNSLIDSDELYDCDRDVLSANDGKSISCIKEHTIVISTSPIHINTNNTVERNNGERGDGSKINKIVEMKIDLTQSFNEPTLLKDKAKLNDEECDNVDLTQSSKSSIDINDLPEVDFDKADSNLDDTIILDKEEYVNKFTKSIIQSGEIFDLTQARDEESTKASNQSVFEDFIHDHSDSRENIDTDSKANEGIDLVLSANESVKSISSDEIRNIKVSKVESDDEDIVLNASTEDIEMVHSPDESVRSISNYEIVNMVHSPDESVRNTSKNEGLTIHNHSSLGKRDEISIDYDEICEYVSDQEINDVKDNEGLKNKSTFIELHIINEVEFDNNDLVSNSSQNSEVFDLTDKELDYSIHKSRCDVDNFNYDFGGISLMDSESGIKLNNDESLNDSELLPEVNIKQVKNNPVLNEAVNKNDKAPKKVVKQNVASIVSVVTPKNSKYIIKTDNITPKLDYASMTTPQRNKELEKYGLKPFKRKRAIQILNHVYNQTHPLIETYLDEDKPSSSKRPRQELHTSPIKVLKSPQKMPKNIFSPEKYKARESPKKPKGVATLQSPRTVQDSAQDNVISAYDVTSYMPIIKAVDCDPADWIFQKREKAKVHTCSVPLQIAFHNYVLSRQGLREAILKYEPVNIDVIHKDLVSYGHRYDPKDLLRFLDKKCITVKTVENNARNKR